MVGQRNMIVEGQKPLLDGLPMSEFVCLGNLVVGLRCVGFCEHHPAPWPSLIVGKVRMSAGRKNLPQWIPGTEYVTQLVCCMLAFLSVVCFPRHSPQRGSL